MIYWHFIPSLAFGCFLGVLEGYFRDHRIGVQEEIFKFWPFINQAYHINQAKQIFYDVLIRLTERTTIANDILRLLDLKASTNIDLGYSLISDISPLVNLKNLETLDLRECSQLVDLSPLANLKNFKNLYLSECSRLTDLSPLTSLKNLEALNLGGCSQLRDLCPLANLQNLENLDLRNCSQLTDLSPLLEIESLQILFLSNGEDLSGKQIKEYILAQSKQDV